MLLFKSSTALAAAYGIAVTGTMAITTVVYYVVVTRSWGWPPWKAGALAGVFLIFDLAFFGIVGTVLTLALAMMWVVVAAKTLAGAWKGHLFVSPCIATPN